MAYSGVRKSSRVKTYKRTSLLSDEFEYDESKFELEDPGFEAEPAKKLELDVSGNISDILNCHSKEKIDDNDDFQARRTSFPNVLGKLQSGEDFDLQLEEGMPCPLCDKYLSTDEELESHIVEHNLSGNEDIQLLACTVCGKIATDIASCIRHMKSHTEDRPFQCDQCPKSFIDSCSLKRHMRSHEDDRPFSCEICHKTFRDSGSISRHMLTHTERPRSFQCSVCNKNFTDKSGLKRHERTHSGVRPYVCNVCQKSFLDSGSFRRHQKIHIGIRNHHCHMCQRSFMEKQSLIRHQKTVCKKLEESESPTDNLDEDDIPFLDNTHVDIHASDIQEIDQVISFQEDIKDSSCIFPSNDNDFTVPLTPKSVANVKHSGTDSPSNAEIIEGQSATKDSPSLSSLIQKDPKLYDSISEIVDSIDSYEKMLDLCGDRGQKEIDDALKRDPVPMPNNLLCFECGELLVDGGNFKSEGKLFHQSMTNAFKCLNCEEEEEDDYGEPPVLMPHFDDLGEEDVKDKDEFRNEKNDETAENFYGWDEPLVEFRERLKKQHGVDFIGDDYPCHLDGNKEDESNRLSSSHFAPFDVQHSSFGHNLPYIEEFGQSQNQDRNNNLNTLDQDLSMNTAEMNEANVNSQLDYEADDPTIPSVFPCHLCTKVFASSSFLALHLDLHRKSPHKCMVCGKTFTSGPALKRHMRLHTGEKPYACPVCKKQFRDPSNFGKHKKSCSQAISMPSPLHSSSSNSAHSTGFTEDHAEKTNGVNTAMINEQTSENVRQDSFIHCSNVNQNETFEEDPDLPVMAVMPVLDDDLIEPSFEEEMQGGTEGGKDDKEIDYISCEICQKLCENKDHLEMHMNYHTGNPDVTCIECGKAFADCFGMKRHMRIHLGIRPYACEYCGRGYCDNWSLKKHKSKGCLSAEVQVPVDLLYPCPQCTRVFSDPDHLQEHMKIHKGLLKFECDVCNKKFSEAFNLKKHRRLHMAICPGCGQEFRNMKLLAIHQESECTVSVLAKDETTADAEKSFSCDICGRVYSTQAYLDRHRKIHSELKPHVCEICNKRFSEAFKLRRHMKASHSDLKPFICQDCGKCFSDDAALKRHSVSSSCALSKVIGEPLNSETCVCQLCDKVFQKNYMLVRHMTVHSQNRPFACDMCGRSYKDTSSLKRHQMTHRGVKDFICSVCGKDFYYADSLKRHIGGRCGKKPKSRRRKAASRKGKKRASTNAKNGIANSNDILNNNNNNNAKNINGIADTLSESNWKAKLHTTPYAPSLVTVVSHPFMFRRVKDAGTSNKFGGNKVKRWSCRRKKHCWRCDSKLPSWSAFKAHRQIHQRKRSFRCFKCFLRFQSKLYWRVHTLSCQNDRPAASCKVKVSRKRSAARHVDASCILPDEITADGGERKRPRRSVPRAKWSWISQI